MNKQIKQHLSENISVDIDVTDVIALRPGLGKSQFIIEEMSKALQNNKRLMIVTDSVERLTQMVNGESVSDEITEFMQREHNRNKIALLTADTYKSEIVTASYKQIIAMTSQRFFRMKPQEINELINGGKSKIERIYIDEQPLILEVKNIGVKQLTQIDDAINTAITNLDNQDDKQQMIDCFNLISDSFRKAFKATEQNNDKDSYTEYYYDSTLESASNTLLQLADKYKSALSAYNYNVIDYIESSVFIANDGGMVVSQKIKTKDESSRYNNYISTVVDFRRWFTDIDCKIICFDGTADINPLYDTEFFNVIDCKQYEQRIRPLTINIIDISAGKTKLIKDKERLQSIIDYLQSEPQQPQAIFTYKDIEKTFNVVTELTAHFNNIKGFNEFRNLTNITQVGLNRYPDHVYKFLCGYSCASKIQPQRKIVLSDNAIAWYKSHGLTVPRVSTAKSTIRIIKYETLIEYRNRLLLSDIVQNIFRSKIREQDNREPVTYNLIFGYSVSDKKSKAKNQQELLANNKLVDLIREYFLPIGATVNLIDTPMQIRLVKIDNCNGDTPSKRIVRWLQEKPIGYRFRVKEVRDDCNINSNNFNSATKNKNGSLYKLFEDMKVYNSNGKPIRGLYEVIESCYMYNSI